MYKHRREMQRYHTDERAALFVRVEPSIKRNQTWCSVKKVGLYSRGWDAEDGYVDMAANKRSEKVKRPVTIMASYW